MAIQNQFNTWDDVLAYISANPNGALTKTVNPGDFMDGVQPDAYGKYRMADGRMLGAGDTEYVNIPGYFGKNTGLQLTPGANGSVTSSQIDLSGDANPLLLAALAAAAAATGGGAFAGMGGTSGASAAGSSAAGAGSAAAPGWVSGYDLAMGSDLTGMTGSGGLVNSVTSAIPQGVKDAAGTAMKVLNSPAGAAIAGGLLSGANGASKAGDQTITTQQAIDPRMAAILYGDQGNNGFINNYILSQLNTPQKTGMSTFGAGMDSYLQNWGTDNFMRSQQAAQQLQSSNISAPTANAAQINAPGQNGINLSPAYQDMVYGEAGNNPYLTGAIQKGINQSTNAFGNYLSDATKAVQDQLSGIRGGAMINGAMGGSRQGIAEGRALSDFGQNLTRAASQFGQNNTDAALAARAGAYDADRNRALSAMSGLGAQQYGVATNNAQLQQQTNLANMQSQLSTNQLNSQNQLAGINASSGLLGQAYGIGQNNDAYDLNKVGKVSGLLGQYTGLGGSSSQTSPLYQNTAGNVMGGAMAGLGLWNAMNKNGGTNTGSVYNYTDPAFGGNGFGF